MGNKRFYVYYNQAEGRPVKVLVFFLCDKVLMFV